MKSPECQENDWSARKLICRQNRTVTSRSLVTDHVVPWELFLADATPSYREAIRQQREDIRREGGLGAYHIVMICEGEAGNLKTAVPYAFSEEEVAWLRTLPGAEAWKGVIKNALNGDIVLHEHYADRPWYS